MQGNASIGEEVGRPAAEHRTTGHTAWLDERNALQQAERSCNRAQEPRPRAVPTLGLAHDYLTQMGGAERVVAVLCRAYPAATLYTALYEPSTTYPDFEQHSVVTTHLNKSKLLRGNHRLALPLLASAFRRMQPTEDIILCSSSGWAHGISAKRKVVYCHTPARWLYQPKAYVGNNAAIGKRVGLGTLAPFLKKWDQYQASTASRYLVNSREIRRRVADAYGIEAEVLPPPIAIDAEGPKHPIEGIAPGYWITVTRLLPYKNVDAIVETFQQRPTARLIIVGEGPDEARLRSMLTPNITLLSRVSDAQLRWLYTNSRGLIAASYEDFGLTPLEANAFGRPAIALRWGGFLDTIIDGSTGVLFDSPNSREIGEALRRADATIWDEKSLTAHADAYSEPRFIERLNLVIDEVVRS